MDGFDAALRQLAGHGEQLALLDVREADHFRQTAGRLAELTSLITSLGETVQDQAAVLTALHGLDEQVAGLAARIAEILPPGDADGEAKSYQAAPAPRWWKLTGQAREEAIGKLRGWVEQVYLPGYGQLAAALAPCWDQHPLCLYALDILAELWSVLYLHDRRTPAMLSAQAEFQARILPALTEQMITETRRCGHAPHHSPANAPVNGPVTGRRA